jgi:hypothetical protein
MAQLYCIYLIREWKLPGTSNYWSGVDIATQDDKKCIYLSQTIPGKIWKFEWSTNEASSLKGSFPQCANVFEGDLEVIRENALSNNRFGGSKLRFVDDF